MAEQKSKITPRHLLPVPAPTSKDWRADSRLRLTERQQVGAGRPRSHGRRLAIFGCAIASTFFAAMPGFVAASQDPFQDPFNQNATGENDPADGSLFGASPAANPSAAAATGLTITDLSALSVMSQSMDTAAKRFLAAETLFNLEQPEAAASVLAGFTDPLTDQAAVDFVEQISTPSILAMLARADFPEAKQAWFDQTIANALAFSTSDQAVQQALTQLIGDDASLHQTAFDRLQAAGLSAANMLLPLMQQEIQQEDFSDGSLRRLVAVIQQGPREWDLALRSIVGSDSDWESAAILGLAARRRDPLNSAAVLSWQFRAKNLPDPKLSGVIRDWNQRFANAYDFPVTDRQTLGIWLRRQLNEQKKVFQMLDDNRSSIQSLDAPGWLWEPSLAALTVRRIERFEKAARDRSQVATALVRVVPSSDIAATEYLTAQLQAAKILGGIDRPLSTSAVELAGQFASPERLSQLLAVTLSEQQWVVAQALLETLGSVGSEALLQPTSGRRSSIVDALQASDQRVRFSAAMAILNWKPQSRFAGSTYFNQALYEVLNAPVGAQSVIASSNQSDAFYLAALTRSAGWDTVVAGNAPELIEQLQIQPLQFAVVTDAMGNDPIVGVIDRIRETARGKTLPIALLVRPENLQKLEAMFKVDRLDRNITVAELSDQTDRMSRILAETANLHAKPQLPMSARQSYAITAIEKLQPWLSDPRSLRLLDIPMIAPAARNLIGSIPAEINVVQILAVHGDPGSQRHLANLATDTSLPNPLRAAAAIGFRQSVKQFGTLLTLDEIRGQYDRQNRSGNDSQFSQQILGSVLDTLEARYKRTPFDKLPPVPQ